MTLNLRDFPDQVLSSLGLEAQDPDAFLLERFHENEDLVLSALTEQVNAYRRPPQTVNELLDELRARCNLPDFVQAVTLRLG